MTRLSADEGVRLYKESGPPSHLLDYNPDVHEQDMKDLATGLIGAMLKLSLPSISGPQLGSPIPMIVTHVPGDLLRIFVHPQIKKDGEHVVLTAFSYTGEMMTLDTRDLDYVPWEQLVQELIFQDSIMD